VRESGSSSLSLAGSLLVAHPGLLDPNFRRSVIFLSSHDPQDGSFGLVLNRPAGRTVSDLLPEKELGNLAHVPVFLGGPVSTDQLIFATFRWRGKDQAIECRHHLVIEDAQEAAKDDWTTIRAFVGYAGWGKGQLESELAQQAWLMQKPEPGMLDLEKCPTLWREITSEFGPWFKLVAEAPEDPSLN
jgi:putative transcriptional regulator